MTDPQTRINNALELLHQPEFMWQCPCCTAIRHALTEGLEDDDE